MAGDLGTKKNRIVIALRDLEEWDAVWIFEACQDPAIQRWTRVPRPYLQSHADQFVRDIETEVCRWVIVDDDRPIGLIGVHSIDMETSDAQIGYWVAPWGRGMRSVAQSIGLVSWYLVERSLATSVSALIAEENVASRRSAELAGMIPVGSLAHGACDDGLSVTALVYRMGIL